MPQRSSAKAPVTTAAKVLLVDDNVDLLKLISLRLKPLMLDIRSATSGEEALSILSLWRADLVVTDLQLPGISGMQLFEQIHNKNPLLPVIILTAHGTIPDAVKATQAGVASYLTKPFDSDTLVAQIQTLLKASGFATDANNSSEVPAWRSNIITKSPLMENLLGLVSDLANADDVVLFEGEAGTGKEELARALHAKSRRASEPFSRVIFATNPEPQLVVDVFGKIGTGSIEQPERIGALQRADGGTFLLSDFRGVSAELLKRLLTAWHERRASPVDSDHVYKFDIRVIATTSRIGKFGQNAESLWQMGPKLEFTTLQVPPLNERREDIPLLITHGLGQVKARSDMQFSNKAVQVLMNAEWPGNVRQLLNVVKQCAALSKNKIITDTLVSSRIGKDSGKIPPLSTAQREFEREYLVDVLKRTHGNVTRAANLAQRNRTEFHRLLKKHKIEAKTFRQNSS
ncbi:transcriptional regulator [Arenicella chitinivorans]|uniref:Transcriptional regulator n=1 Tax=Arenicella chitinivorans TaxID=1329800 RepID=A0A918RQA7_9GAMM|nr:response regulator [Arenicella chitinivorans]GHA07310.1 transcriptional regulator [Arenicella chitinivorans]